MSADRSDPLEGNGRWRGTAADNRPEIKVLPGELDLVITKAERALLEAQSNVFQRGGQLVRPGQFDTSDASGRTIKAPSLQVLTNASLMEELSRAANWQKYDERRQAWRIVDPPPTAVQGLLARAGRWHLRSVAGVIACPTMRQDGTILFAPGYDPNTRLFYLPDRTLKFDKFNENPNRDDALEAIDILKELLSEFPFVSKSDGMAVALSAVISAVARGALGMVPIHAFTGTAPNSGKTLLCDIVSTIVSGRHCPVITAARSEEELEKRLGAMLLAGHSLISIDNVSTEISGDALCQIAERPSIRIRVLGKSETPECEFRGIVLANGNNLVVHGDLVRRTVVARLDPPEARPEMHKFKNKPLEKILEDRGKYIAAALTIVRAYRVADFPGKMNPIGSYREWSDNVRSSLVWLGVGDPWETTKEARESDPVLGVLRAVLKAWQGALGSAPVTARDLVDAAAHDGVLSDALLLVCSVRGECDVARLGYWLRKNKGRKVDGLRIAGAGVAHRGVAAWRCEETRPQADGWATDITAIATGHIADLEGIGGDGGDGGDVLGLRG